MRPDRADLATLVLDLREHYYRRQKLFFFVPEGFTFASSSAVGAEVKSPTMKGERLLVVTLESAAAGAVTWGLRFAAAAGVARPAVSQPRP